MRFLHSECGTTPMCSKAAKWCSRVLARNCSSTPMCDKPISEAEASLAGVKRRFHLTSRRLLKSATAVVCLQSPACSHGKQCEDFRIPRVDDEREFCSPGKSAAITRYGLRGRRPVYRKRSWRTRLTSTGPTLAKWSESSET